MIGDFAGDANSNEVPSLLGLAYLQSGRHSDAAIGRSMSLKSEPGSRNRRRDGSGAGSVMVSVIMISCLPVSRYKNIHSLNHCLGEHSGWSYQRQLVC